MSESASISTGIAARYATAIFELAKEGGSVAALESDVDALAATLDDSAEFADLISSPMYRREEQANAIGAIAAKMALSETTSSALRLMAAKRRLFVLPHLLRALRERIADDKGEVTADVASAKAMTKTQSEKLAKALQASIGREIKINATVDEDLIGGLVVKVGSKMIDTSIRSKLNALKNSMKEVG